MSKFADCKDCRWRRRRDICADCDMGELFEDRDTPGVDEQFRQAPTRFGESVSADDISQREGLDADRFVDGLDEDDSDFEDKDLPYAD